MALYTEMELLRELQPVKGILHVAVNSIQVISLPGSRPEGDNGGWENAWDKLHTDIRAAEDVIRAIKKKAEKEGVPADMLGKVSELATEITELRSFSDMVTTTRTTEKVRKEFASNLTAAHTHVAGLDQELRKKL